MPRTSRHIAAQPASHEIGDSVRELLLGKS
jgi:hypothetical protein